MSRKKTIEEFKKDVFNIHGDNVIVLGEYINNQEKILIQYKDCGHREMKRPTKILAGQGCGLCTGKRISRSKLKTTKEIKEKLLKFNIELIGEYEGLRHKTKIKNNNCNHTYKANLQNVLNGSGCPICHGFKDTDKFKQQVFEKYGNEYTVLGNYINNKTKIMVRHEECGHEWEVIPKDLLKDRRCPKCIISKGELFIKDYLDKNNVYYEMQFRYKDCKNKIPLPFDFMVKINDEIKLIEFDGCQHFKQGGNWGQENFNRTIENDNIKNEYCIKNKIPLLRIPYWWIRNDKAERELNKFLFKL